MKDERLGDVEEWVRGNGLDDSLLVQYNMDSVTALKQPLTTTVPLFAATATQKKGDGKGCDDDEGTKKYVVGPNYHSHPKMNVSTPVNETAPVVKTKLLVFVKIASSILFCGMQLLQLFM